MRSPMPKPGIMQTFDQSLFQFFQDGRISEEEAFNNPDSRNDLGLNIRLSRESSTHDGPEGWEIRT